MNKELKSQSENLAKRLSNLERGRGEPSKKDPEREMLKSMESAAFKDDFLEARRSMILSPCTASPEAARAFLSTKMLVDDEILQDLIVQEIKRLHKKGKTRGQTEKRVRITFSSIYERDLIMSFASNLPKEASVEVVIPDHLLSLKRFLDSFAYRIRTNARENNEKVSTSVRLDDADQTLVLAVKNRKDNTWKSYTCLLYTSPSPRD